MSKMPSNNKTSIRSKQNKKPCQQPSTLVKSTTLSKFDPPQLNSINNLSSPTLIVPSESLNVRNINNIAVLIDGENAEASYISEVIAEAGRFGRVTVKRVYGDWSRPIMKSWKPQ